MDGSSSSLQKSAIDAALNSRWDEALKINRQIIKLDPQNVDALNRQARCYMEVGKSNLAKKYYLEALKFDPYNPIALKNLKIIKAYKGSNGDHRIFDGQAKIAADMFLREPGKTKVVTLLKVAEPKILSQTFCGMPVVMTLKNKKIIVSDQNGDYLGVLPDDVCHHLIRLVKGGNKYDTIIKSIKVNGLSVLIKETYRSKRFKNQPSFLDGKEHQVLDLIPSLDTDDQEEAESEEEES